MLEDERGAPGFPEVPARDDRCHVPEAIHWFPMRLRSRQGCGSGEVHRRVGGHRGHEELDDPRVPRRVGVQQLDFLIE